MFYHQDAELEKLIIHRVGNKSQDEFYALSEGPIDISTDEVLPGLLKQYFLSPFAKVNEVYRLFHPNEDLQLNEVHYFTKQYFDGKMNFQDYSENIVKHLYEASTHPKIKSGEVYVVDVKNVQQEGEELHAIGIFKSENKETYLKVYPQNGGFEVNYEQEAININKLDKGVIILNSEADEGFKVLVVDQTNQSEAVYWKDEFLQIRPRNDAFQQTGNFLKVYKNFVNEKLDDSFEMDKADKIDLLNRSMDYFKTKETFDKEEFQEEILGNPKAISLFNDYQKEMQDDLDMEIDSIFTIANQAVKKMQATYKSILKLDKNFSVYVHGKREWLEKGYDDEKGKNYYKLYFEQEN